MHLGLVHLLLDAGGRENTLGCHSERSTEPAGLTHSPRAKSLVVGVQSHLIV